MRATWPLSPVRVMKPFAYALNAAETSVKSTVYVCAWPGASVKEDGDTVTFRPVRPDTLAVYVSVLSVTFVTVRWRVSAPARAPIAIDGRFSSFGRIARLGQAELTELPIVEQMNPRYLLKPPDWYTRPGSRNFFGSTWPAPCANGSLPLFR